MKELTEITFSEVLENLNKEYLLATDEYERCLDTTTILSKGTGREIIIDVLSNYFDLEEINTTTNLKELVESFEMINGDGDDYYRVYPL